MKKLIKIYFALIIVIVFCFVWTMDLEARSGCCSHHGGVCGCHCCDGTSLSATCAPYYPSCSSSNSSAPKPTLAPVSTPQPTPKSQVKPELDPEPTPININTPKQENPQSSYTAQIQDKIDKSYNWIYWLIGIISLGGIIWAWNRKK